MRYIVMMPGSWGKGDSISEAEKIARKEGSHGRKRLPKICYAFDLEKTPKCFIDDTGSLCWEGEQPLRIAL